MRNLRLILFVIILATLPLYCLGFVLWGLAPGGPATPSATPTSLPPAATATPAPSSTPDFLLLVTSTPLAPLLPTPRQFIPPPTLPPLPTATLPPTITPTPAPTATVIPIQSR